MVPLSLGTPHLQPAPSGAGDSCCPGLRLLWGRGWARQGGGGVCTRRGPLPGIGETEAQSPGCGWALRPHLIQLGAVLAVRLSLVSAGRSDSLCGGLGPCPSLPWALLCPSVDLSVTLSVPVPVPQSVHLYLSDICLCPFACLPLSFRGFSVIVCCYSSVFARLSARSFCLSAFLPLPHSVWLKLTPGHFSKEPQTLPL